MKTSLTLIKPHVRRSNDTTPYIHVRNGGLLLSPNASNLFSIKKGDHFHLYKNGKPGNYLLEKVSKKDQNTMQCIKHEEGKTGLLSTSHFRHENVGDLSYIPLTKVTKGKKTYLEFNLKNGSAGKVKYNGKSNSRSNKR